MSDAELIDAYSKMKSSHKVAKAYNTSRQAVRRRLKELGKLLSLSESHKVRDRKNAGKYERTETHKKQLSELAKKRTGSKNPFYDKKHKIDVIKKLSSAAKNRTEKRNPNYKHGNYQRRPRDFKNHQLAPLRNFVFNRDKHTCFYCKQKGGHLHAHHILPYWICNAAFLDSENMITTCSTCHFEKAHLGNWHKFDLNLINDRLRKKYNIRGERLNELASEFDKSDDAIVRSSNIDKIEDKS